jgi:outer membrane protein assembly factor BamB
MEHGETLARAPALWSARSRLGVAGMAVAGVAACVPLGLIAGFVAFFLTAWGSTPAYYVVAPLIFALITVAPAVGLWGTGTRLRRGFASGLVLGWAGAVTAFGWWIVSTYISTHGPAAITAFDSQTGRRLWNAEFDAANGAGTPTTWGGLVFVQTGRTYDSPAGVLAALDARNGRQLWQVSTDAAPAGCGGAGALDAPPVVADGVAVVRAPDGHIRGIDARDGSERWRARVRGAPAAAGDGVVVVGARTTFIALDLVTGERRWTADVAEAAWRDSTPGEHAFVVGAGSVFIVELATQASFGVVALDAGTGRTLWRDVVGSVDSTVQRYVADGSTTLAALEGGPQTGPSGQELRLAGRDLRTGRLLWRQEKLPLGEADLPRTAVAADGGRVFHASSSGQLVAVDARSAAGRWTASFPREDALFPPRLTAGQDAVVVRHVNRLNVFDPITGVRRWTTRLDSGADPETTPAVGQRLVMVPRSSSPCMPPISSGMGAT